LWRARARRLALPPLAAPVLGLAIGIGLGLALLFGCG
jgi:hypothetical protein